MANTAAQNQNLPQASLYVGDLHPLVTESMLYATFSNIGQVLSARVCRDVARQSSLCYGYVNFENPKDAERALESLIYENILGRQIRIMWCVRDPSLRKSGRGNIFIKNLDKGIAQKDLYDTFSHFGKILSCKIASDESGNSKGSDLTDEAFKEIFSEFGEIKSACIMRDDEGKSKGFGFVCFNDPDHAEAAVNTLNGKEVNGQVLYVNRAQRKAERQEVLRQQFEKQRNERIAKYAAGINLYVKNLDDSIDDARLKEAFGKFGKITSAKVMTDANGTSKGFGFVCFTSPEEAKEAAKLNGTLLGSKPLYVALAQRREDRRAKLLAEHQQRLQYRPNVANIPTAHGLPSFFGQPPFNPTQRFFQTGAPLASQPRWNRGAITGPQVQLGHPGIGATPALRPTVGTPYVGGSGAMTAMGQGQLAQGNLVNPQFRGQTAGRSMITSAIPTLGAGATNGMVAAGANGPQQYGAQRPGIPAQILGAAGAVPRATMAAVTAGIRPNPMNQAVRSIAQSNVAVVPPAAATAAANPPRAMVSPARLTVSEQVQPQTAVSNQQHSLQPQQQSQQEEEKKKEVEDGASLDLTPEQLAYRQIVGEQLFAKIQVTHPTNTGKLTGMLLNLDPTFWEKMINSEEYLHQRINECILLLEKKEKDEQAARSAQSEVKKTDRS
ncbi:Polyadenylate-binding protein 4 [Taenia crassiceps]|uniref:Polyadenylate-binding protein 4 n=1 Tax=Taenia crassiceps TaxID=6207 RepID=A0ABR4QDQ2_9CEST